MSFKDATWNHHSEGDSLAASSIVEQWISHRMLDATIFVRHQKNEIRLREGEISSRSADGLAARYLLLLFIGKFDCDILWDLPYAPLSHCAHLCFFFCIREVRSDLPWNIGIRF